MLRLLVVDDHEAIRIGMDQCLRSSELEVSTLTGDADQVLAALEKENIDLVLLDVQLGGTEDGLAQFSRIHEAFPDVPVVLFSSFDYHVYIARAAANGVHGYLLKSDSVQRIKEVLSHVCRNKRPTPGGRIEHMKQLLTEPPENSGLTDEISLTHREKQVLRHVAYGLSNREIASSLSISIETVKEHVQNVLRKSGARDRTDAAVKAIRSGFAE
ncbi:MAG: response regulator transcription factor [Planctomycetota bacterium]